MGKRDEFADALLKVAKTAKPQEKLEILTLLMNWRTEGCAELYVHALADVLSDPSYVFDRESESVLWTFPTIKKVEELTPFRTSEWLSLILGGKNSAIVAFFVRTYGPLMSPADKASLAQKLLDPDLQVRLAVANKLAIANKDEEHAPGYFKDEDESAPFIEYWKRIYKIGTTG